MLDEASKFLNYIGAKHISSEDGKALVRLDVQPQHRQHLKYVHGGVISTLCDNTGWYALISSLEKGYTSVTIEIKINYLKPASGDILDVKAEVVRKGKTTGFVKIEVFSGDELVAFSTGTYAIIKEVK